MDSQEPTDGTSGPESRVPPPVSEGEAQEDLRRDDPAGVVTGVCAGLGRYTRIDPVVWRMAFVLTGLAGGTGLWLYLGAWAMMRDAYGGPAMAEQFLNRRITPHAVLTLLGAGLAAATVLSLVGGFSWGTLVLATCLILGLLVAHGRGVDLREAVQNLPQELSSTEPAPQASAPEAVTTYYNPSDPWPGAEARAPVDLAVVAGHSTAGSAQEEEYEQEKEEGCSPARSGKSRRRRGVLLLPFALLAVLAATGAAFALFRSVTLAALFGPTTGPLYLGGVAVIIGAVLVLGTWVGDARGLSALGTAAILLAVATATVDMAGVRIGEATWRPVSVAEAERSYELTAGSAVLDLSRLPLAEGDSLEAEARVGLGELVVLVPESARVELEGRVGLGTLRVAESEERSGPRITVQETLEPAAAPPPGDGPPEEPPVIMLELRTFGGEMQVRRG